MAAQGATLQNYNNELVKCVDDLKEKREEVNKAILKDVRANRSSAVTAALRDGCARAAERAGGWWGLRLARGAGRCVAVGSAARSSRRERGPAAADVGSAASRRSSRAQSGYRRSR